MMTAQVRKSIGMRWIAAATAVLSWSSSVLASTAAPGSAELDALLEASDQSGSSALVVTRRGELVAQRGESSPDELISIQSITKSVVSLVVGVLVAEGKIASVDDPISKYLPSYTGDKRERVTIRHVLAHRSGMEAGDNFGLDVEKADDALAWAMKAPISADPGARYSYNNGAMQLIRGVVEQASGQSLDALVEQRLLKPLGIDRYEWARDRSGKVWAHAALQLRASDVAKIGQLVAGRGTFNGTRVIDERWFDVATPRRVDGDLAEVGMGLWWNLAFEQATSRIVINATAIDAMEQHGLAPELAAKLRALPPEMDEADFAQRYVAAFSRDEQMAIRTARLAAGASLLRRRGELEAVFSTGGGGQYLYVHPASGVVVVRLIKPDAIKDGTTQFRDFIERAASYANAAGAAR